MTDSAATKIQNLGVNILNQSISQRFQEQVIRYGDRVAIQYQDRTITYNEQDLRSVAIYSAFLTINLDIYTTSSAFT